MPDQSSAASEHALLQEITAPLATLPDDPLALVEADFPTTMRGYDRHAVDDYVDQVTRLVDELHSTRTPEAAVRRALEKVGDQISGILQRAHETAESITAQSRSEAEDRLEQARREGATIVEAAERRVRELDADTDRIWTERQQVVVDAEDLSERLRAVAREAAERFPTSGVPDAPGEAGELPGPAAEGPGVSAQAPPGAAAAPEEAAEASDAAPETLADVPAAAADETEDETEVRPAEPVTESQPAAPPSPPSPTAVTDDDSTRIIPPSSDAAQHRHDS